MRSPREWGGSEGCQARLLLGASAQSPTRFLSQSFRNQASHTLLRWEPSQSCWEGLRVNHKEMHSLS